MSTTTGVTTQVYRIYIKATPQAVWDAITNPEWTERYGGERVDFDLRPGGRFRAFASERMKANGAEIGLEVPAVMADGEVMEADRPRRLSYTWRLLFGEGMADRLTRITWEIDEVEPSLSRVTVVHDLGDAPVVAEMVSGGMEDRGAGGGWNEVLSGLKTLLETGEPLRG